MQEDGAWPRMENGVLGEKRRDKVKQTGPVTGAREGEGGSYRIGMAADEVE